MRIKSSLKTEPVTCLTLEIDDPYSYRLASALELLIDFHCPMLVPEEEKLYTQCY